MPRNGSLERRLRAVEELVQDNRGPSPQEQQYEEFLAKLTRDELKWMLEPLHEGTRNTLCPRHGEVCGCRSDERKELALELFPEIRVEFAERRDALMKKVDKRRAKNGG
jgi:hypothetical protein